MKALFTIILIFGVTLCLPAQWIQSGNDIRYSNGRVGIGVQPSGMWTIPQSLLHLRIADPGRPTVFAIDNDNDTNNNGAVISFRTRTVGAPSPNEWQYQEFAAIRATFGNHDYTFRRSELEFFTTHGDYNPASLTTVRRMIIKSDGRVGIGTYNPTERLTVRGKILAEEVRVVVNVPADYVFEKSYPLRSLAEVEDFIKINGHLPGLPPAEQIIEEGWQVGEMSNKLLEKVEELTLYVIELKKENQQLKASVEALQEKVNE